VGPRRERGHEADHQVVSRPGRDARSWRCATACHIFVGAFVRSDERGSVISLGMGGCPLNFLAATRSLVSRGRAAWFSASLPMVFLDGARHGDPHTFERYGVLSWWHFPRRSGRLLLDRGAGARSWPGLVFFLCSGPARLTFRAAPSACARSAVVWLDSGAPTLLGVFTGTLTWLSPSGLHIPSQGTAVETKWTCGDHLLRLV